MNISIHQLPAVCPVLVLHSDAMQVSGETVNLDELPNLADVLDDHAVQLEREAQALRERSKLYRVIAGKAIHFATPHNEVLSECPRLAPRDRG